MAVEFENLNQTTKVIFLTCLAILAYLLVFALLKSISPPRTPIEYVMGLNISSQGQGFMHVVSILIAICVTFFFSVQLGKVKVPTVEEIVHREVKKKPARKRKR